MAALNERRVLVSGICAAGVAILVSAIYIVRQPEKGIGLASTFVLILLVPVAAAFIVPLVGFITGLQNGLSVVPITHGLLPLLQRRWRLFVGIPLWIAALVVLGFSFV